MAALENNLTVDNRAANEHSSLFLDKTEIRRIMVEQNAKSGFVPNPMATAETAQALIRACLLEREIKLEDNIFSQGIIEAREEN